MFNYYVLQLLNNLLWNLSLYMNNNHKSDGTVVQRARYITDNCILHIRLPQHDKVAIPSLYWYFPTIACSMHYSASQVVWAKRLGVGRIPNILTTSYQSSPPKLLCTLVCFRSFLLWGMSRVKHETGVNVHHCSTRHNILLHTALFALQGNKMRTLFLDVFQLLCFHTTRPVACHTSG